MTGKLLVVTQRVGERLVRNCRPVLFESLHLVAVDASVRFLDHLLKVYGEGAAREARRSLWIETRPVRRRAMRI